MNGIVVKAVAIVLLESMDGWRYLVGASKTKSPTLSDIEWYEYSFNDPTPVRPHPRCGMLFWLFDDEVFPLPRRVEIHIRKNGDVESPNQALWVPGNPARHLLENSIVPKKVVHVDY